MKESDVHTFKTRSKKALVVGYGSIGARHTRLLLAMGLTVAAVSRRPAVYEKCYSSLNEALALFNPDYIVVATETNRHYETLTTIENSGFLGPVLVEKPLREIGDAPFEPKNPAVFVAFNLRFHPILRALREQLKGRRLLSAEIRCGSYLPEWRPGRDYRQTSSARRATGGGVLRDLSHELDYVNWLFGSWTRLAAIGGQFSSLDIDVEDVFVILAETKNCPVVSIMLNYVEHGNRRTILINTDETTFIADLEAGTLIANDKLMASVNLNIDDTYRDQHLSVLSGQTDCVCSLGEGLLVMSMMSAAEEAAALGSWIHR